MTRSRLLFRLSDGAVASVDILAASVLLIGGVEEEHVEPPNLSIKSLRTVMQESVDAVESERVIFGRIVLGFLFLAAKSVLEVGESGRLVGRKRTLAVMIEARPLRRSSPLKSC